MVPAFRKTVMKVVASVMFMVIVIMKVMKAVIVEVKVL
jgi:hypothetical protein